MPNINLLPWRDELREELKRQFFMVLVGAVAISILVLLLTHGIVGKKITHQTIRNQFLTQEINVLDKQIQEIKELKKKREALIARMNIIKQLQSNRPRVVHLFDELVTILPKGVHLSKVIRKGRVVTLLGKSESNTNVSDLMRSVERSKWLTDPSLNEIITNKLKGNYLSEFKLDMLQETPKIDQKAS